VKKKKEEKTLVRCIMKNRQEHREQTGGRQNEKNEAPVGNDLRDHAAGQKRGEGESAGN